MFLELPALHQLHLQYAFPEIASYPIPLDENARTPINDLVTEIVVLDISNNTIIFRTRLNPDGWNVERFDLLEQAEGYFRWSYDANGCVRRIGQVSEGLDRLDALQLRFLRMDWGDVEFSSLVPFEDLDLFVRIVV
jgi:hypothetical protein